MEDFGGRAFGTFCENYCNTENWVELVLNGT